MLTAIQDATGRLAALGRQATDLAVTLERPSLDGEAAPVAALLEAATHQAALQAPPTLQLPAAVADARVPFGKNPQVVAAFGALIQAVSRDAVGAPIAVDGAQPDHATVELRFGPTERLAATARDQSGDSSNATLRLDRGGLGLSLVLASYVFDAIGARLSSIGPDGSAISVTLRKEGGLL